MGRLSSALLKGIGALVLALVVLGVVGTIVGIALSIIVAVLSLLVSLAVLSVFVLTVVGLASLLGTGATAEDGRRAPHRSDDRVDPEERLRSKYVAGELDDYEFERELERLLGPDERTGRSRSSRSSDRGAATDRRRHRNR